MERKRFSAKERLQVYNKCNGHCAYCGCELNVKDMQIDHVQSLYWHDGSNEMDNLLPACRSCNHYKGTSTLENFRKNLERMPQVLIRKFLRGQLAMGRKCLPMGRCSNFDYQTGCKGHEHPEKWLKLKSIGLRNPTEVENDEGKTLVTVGLDIIGLVQKWKEHFGFREETTIWLEADENLIQSCRKKAEIEGVKTVEEAFNEQRVYFWEEKE